MTRGMLGILMLIRHWDEVQSNRANNGAGARESGQGADTEGRLQRPGPASACRGGPWRNLGGESRWRVGATNPYQLIIYGSSKCWVPISSCFLSWLIRQQLVGRGGRWTRTSTQTAPAAQNLQRAHSCSSLHLFVQLSCCCSSNRPSSPLFSLPPSSRK